MEFMKSMEMFGECESLSDESCNILFEFGRCVIFVVGCVDLLGIGVATVYDGDTERDVVWFHPHCSVNNVWVLGEFCSDDDIREAIP